MVGSGKKMILDTPPPSSLLHIRQNTQPCTVNNIAALTNPKGLTYLRHQFLDPTTMTKHLRRKWEDNIKIDLWEIRLEGVNFIYLV
jgi:hypothetical protein